MRSELLPSFYMNEETDFEKLQQYKTLWKWVCLIPVPTFFILILLNPNSSLTLESQKLEAGSKTT